MHESNPNAESTRRNCGHDSDPALWGLRFREAKLLGAMADAQSRFAAANLGEIKNRMSAPAVNSGNKARMSMKTKGKDKKSKAEELGSRDQPSTPSLDFSTNAVVGAVREPPLRRPHGIRGTKRECL